jgi:hypothetical protein
MDHVVFYSGGIGSWGAAKRVAERHGTEHLVLLFTDTCMEDPDLYRFLEDSTRELYGDNLVRIADGRNPWQVFRDVRFLGNSRIDPCSRMLKRDLSRKWVLESYPDPNDVTLYLGIDWTESHRFETAAKRWEPYRLEAPLCESPYVLKADLLFQLQEEEIEPPRLYSMGFAHNNCGGFCVKAGHAQFAHMLKVLPEVYARHEAEEEAFRADYGDVSILNDRRGGGPRRPMSLRAFRERLEQEALSAEESAEWGGCGCFL